MRLVNQPIWFFLFSFLALGPFCAFSDENPPAAAAPSAESAEPGEDEKLDRLAQIAARREEMIGDYETRQRELEARMKAALSMPAGTREEQQARRAMIQETAGQKKELKKSLNAEMKRLNDEEEILRVGKEALELRRQRAQQIISQKQQALLEQKRAQEARKEAERPPEKPAKKKKAETKERAGYDSSEQRPLNPKIKVDHVGLRGIDRVKGPPSEW